MKLYRLLSVLFIFALSINISNAQKRNKLFLDYIDQYNGVAIQNMKEFKIPASIILAQGLLESGAGQSTLAKKSNNHFGIKCGSSWKGKTVRHHDDARNECFRAYKNSKESYDDHARFLTSGSRYAFLFKLDIMDYKAWAKGLKKTGYATDPSYANRLIQIIEDYELYQYDAKAKGKKGASTKTIINPHQLYLANGLVYVIARRGDSFESLSKEFGIRESKLIKYNDLHKNYTLADGDVIYLKTKKKQADKKYSMHIVRGNESMHTISQIYGIRLKNLYKMNNKDPEEYMPQVGDRLRVR